MDHRARLLAFRPRHEYLVCIDSDGCAFDNMGIKQRECFAPWMIAYFDLQPVAQAARECKEFADLLSKTRGANRHITLKRILTELLPSHPQVRDRGFEVPNLPHYFAWVNDSRSLLSNEGLRQAMENAETEEARREFQLVLDWSKRVNSAIEEIVHGIPPFAGVREALLTMRENADVVIVSATPLEAIEREWRESGIYEFADLICGQEMGTKAEHIAAAARYYPKDHALMIGDAPGDLEAANSNGALFFPIIPGKEEESWRKLNSEALPRFFAGTYAGEYQERLILEFDLALPDRPPWEMRK